MNPVMQIIAAFLIGLLLMMLLPLAAEARAHCAERASIVGKLETGYGETRQAMGLGANSALVEVFANPETGTWSITVTRPNGQTCLVASGQAFESLHEVLLEGEPT